MFDEEDDSLEAKMLKIQDQRNREALQKLNPFAPKDTKLGTEIPQARMQGQRPTPKPYNTEYPSDQKFEDARNKLVDQSKRMMPSGMDAQRLKELQNQLDMEESEAEFDGMTPEVQQKIMRLKEAIKRMGG